MTWFVFSGSKLYGKVAAATSALAVKVAEATFDTSLPIIFSVVPVGAA